MLWSRQNVMPSAAELVIWQRSRKQKLLIRWVSLRLLINLLVQVKTFLVCLNTVVMIMTRKTSHLPCFCGSRPPCPIRPPVS